MDMLIWVAAAWLAAAACVTLVVFGARRSRLLHDWLFGERPTAELHRLPAPATSEAPTRLAA